MLYYILLILFNDSNINKYYDVVPDEVIEDGFAGISDFKAYDDKELVKTYDDN